MQISPKQLKAHLKQTLSSLYLLSGDEPLLLQETRDEIINAAKFREFTEKETFYIDSGFQIETLIESVFNGSLFATKKIIDIRNATAKMDTAFIIFLKNYLSFTIGLTPKDEMRGADERVTGVNKLVNEDYERVRNEADRFSRRSTADDRIIIISTNKLSTSQQKTEWYELIKQHGVIIPIWPIRSNELPAWIIERAKEFHLTFSIDVAQMLAHFSEGNILSAQQAIEKLSMSYPNKNITREQLMTVLFDHARFGIFDLSESIMSGNPKKILRILTRLEQTGEEPTLVLWAICRKLRENSSSDKAKIALQKAARVDEIIKGARMGNVWEAMSELCAHAAA